MLKKFQNLKGNSATFFVELSKLKEGLWSGKNNIKILADCSDEEILNFAEIQNFLGDAQLFQIFCCGVFFPGPHWKILLGNKDCWTATYKSLDENTWSNILKIWKVFTTNNFYLSHRKKKFKLSTRCTFSNYIYAITLNRNWAEKQATELLMWHTVVPPIWSVLCPWCCLY